MLKSIENQKFVKLKTAENSLVKAEYDICQFVDCDFSGSNFRDFVFAECTFTNCNLSNIEIANAAFKDVKFVNCKALGLQFANCNPFLFEVAFNDCILNHCSFYKTNLKKTIF